MVECTETQVIQMVRCKLKSLKRPTSCTTVSWDSTY